MDQLMKDILTLSRVQRMELPAEEIEQREHHQRGVAAAR